LQERIEQVGDNADLQEVYDTERHLLYVACTRARDLTGLETGSASATGFARAMDMAESSSSLLRSRVLRLTSARTELSGPTEPPADTQPP
jgi:hypothetical protein